MIGAGGRGGLGARDVEQVREPTSIYNQIHAMQHTPVLPVVRTNVSLEEQHNRVVLPESASTFSSIDSVGT